MRITVLCEGVPIGTGELIAAEDTFSVEADALPGYAAFQPALADARRAMANYGFLPSAGSWVGGVTPEGDAAGRAALDRQRVVEAALELRDVDGVELPTRGVFICDGDSTGFSLMGWLDIADERAR